MRGCAEVPSDPTDGDAIVSGCLEPRLRGGAGRDGFMRFYSCCTGIFKLKVKTAKLLKLLLNTTFRKGDLL